MPSDLEVKMGLAIVGYPAIAASAGLVAARLMKPGKLREAAVVAAAGAGLVTSHVALVEWPKWQPTDSIGWVPLTTVAVAIVALAATILTANCSQRKTAMVAGVATFVAVALAVYFSGKPTFGRELGRLPVLALVPAGLGALAVASHRSLSESSVPATPWLALLATAGLAALCGLWGSSALLAMLIGSMATTAGALGIGGAILRLKTPAPFAHMVFVSHFAATFSYAYLYAKISFLAWALTMLSLALPSLVMLWRNAETKPRFAKVAIAVVLAAACAGAAALSMKPPPEDPNNPANMYGG